MDLEFDATYGDLEEISFDEADDAVEVLDDDMEWRQFERRHLPPRRDKKRDERRRSQRKETPESRRRSCTVTEKDLRRRREKDNSNRSLESSRTVDQHGRRIVRKDGSANGLNDFYRTFSRQKGVWADDEADSKDTSRTFHQQKGVWADDKNKDSTRRFHLQKRILPDEDEHRATSRTFHRHKGVWADDDDDIAYVNTSDEDGDVPDAANRRVVASDDSDFKESRLQSSDHSRLKETDRNSGRKRKMNEPPRKEKRRKTEERDECQRDSLKSANPFADDLSLSLRVMRRLEDRTDDDESSPSASPTLRTDPLTESLSLPVHSFDVDIYESVAPPLLSLDAFCDPAVKNLLPSTEPPALLRLFSELMLEVKISPLPLEWHAEILKAAWSAVDVTPHKELEFRRDKDDYVFDCFIENVHCVSGIGDDVKYAESTGFKLFVEKLRCSDYVKIETIFKGSKKVERLGLYATFAEAAEGSFRYDLLCQDKTVLKENLPNCTYCNGKGHIIYFCMKWQMENSLYVTAPLFPDDGTLPDNFVARERGTNQVSTSDHVTANHLSRSDQIGETVNSQTTTDLPVQHIPIISTGLSGEMKAKENKEIQPFPTNVETVQKNENTFSNVTVKTHPSAEEKLIADLMVTIKLNFSCFSKNQHSNYGNYRTAEHLFYDSVMKHKGNIELRTNDNNFEMLINNVFVLQRNFKEGYEENNRKIFLEDLTKMFNDCNFLKIFKGERDVLMMSETKVTEPVEFYRYGDISNFSSLVQVIPEQNLTVSRPIPTLFSGKINDNESINKLHSPVSFYGGSTSPVSTLGTDTFSQSDSGATKVNNPIRKKMFLLSSHNTAKKNVSSFKLKNSKQTTSHDSGEIETATTKNLPNSGNGKAFENITKDSKKNSSAHVMEVTNSPKKKLAPKVDNPPSKKVLVQLSSKKTTNEYLFSCKSNNSQFNSHGSEGSKKSPDLIIIPDPLISPSKKKKMLDECNPKSVKEANKSLKTNMMTIQQTNVKDSCKDTEHNIDLNSSNNKKCQDLHLELRGNKEGKQLQAVDNRNKVKENKDINMKDSQVRILEKSCDDSGSFCNDIEVSSSKSVGDPNSSIKLPLSLEKDKVNRLMTAATPIEKSFAKFMHEIKLVYTDQIKKFANYEEYLKLIDSKKLANEIQDIMKKNNMVLSKRLENHKWNFYLNNILIFISKYNDHKDAILEFYQRIVSVMVRCDHLKLIPVNGKPRMYFYESGKDLIKGAYKYDFICELFNDFNTPLTADPKNNINDSQDLKCTLEPKHLKEKNQQDGPNLKKVEESNDANVNFQQENICLSDKAKLSEKCSKLLHLGMQYSHYFPLHPENIKGKLIIGESTAVTALERNFSKLMQCIKNTFKFLYRLSKLSNRYESKLGGECNKKELASLFEEILKRNEMLLNKIRDQKFWKFKINDVVVFWSKKSSVSEALNQFYQQTVCQIVRHDYFKLDLVNNELTLKLFETEKEAVNGSYRYDYFCNSNIQELPCDKAEIKFPEADVIGESLSSKADSLSKESKLSNAIDKSLNFHEKLKSSNSGEAKSNQVQDITITPVEKLNVQIKLTTECQNFLDYGLKSFHLFPLHPENIEGVLIVGHDNGMAASLATDTEKGMAKLMQTIKNTFSFLYNIPKFSDRYETVIGQKCTKQELSFIFEEVLKFNGMVLSSSHDNNLWQFKVNDIFILSSKKNCFQDAQNQFYRRAASLIVRSDYLKLETKEENLKLLLYDTEKEAVQGSYRYDSLCNNTENTSLLAEPLLNIQEKDFIDKAKKTVDIKDSSKIVDNEQTVNYKSINGRPILLKNIDKPLRIGETSNSFEPSAIEKSMGKLLLKIKKRFTFLYSAIEDNLMEECLSKKYKSNRISAILTEIISSLDMDSVTEQTKKKKTWNFKISEVLVSEAQLTAPMSSVLSHFYTKFVCMAVKSDYLKILNKEGVQRLVLFSTSTEASSGAIRYDILCDNRVQESLVSKQIEKESESKPKSKSSAEKTEVEERPVNKSERDAIVRDLAKKIYESNKHRYSLPNTENVNLSQNSMTVGSSRLETTFYTSVDKELYPSETPGYSQQHREQIKEHYCTEDYNWSNSDFYNPDFRNSAHSNSGSISESSRAYFEQSSMDSQYYNKTESFSGEYCHNYNPDFHHSRNSGNLSQGGHNYFQQSGAVETLYNQQNQFPAAEGNKNIESNITHQPSIKSNVTNQSPITAPEIVSETNKIFNRLEPPLKPNISYDGPFVISTQKNQRLATPLECQFSEVMFTLKLKFLHLLKQLHYEVPDSILPNLKIGKKIPNYEKILKDALEREHLAIEFKLKNKNGNKHPSSYILDVYMAGALFQSENININKLSEMKQKYYLKIIGKILRSDYIMIAEQKISDSVFNKIHLSESCLEAPENSFRYDKLCKLRQRQKRKPNQLPEKELKTFYASLQSDNDSFMIPTTLPSTNKNN